jgi:hypothetical protein
MNYYFLNEKMQTHQNTHLLAIKYYNSNDTKIFIINFFGTFLDI